MTAEASRAVEPLVECYERVREDEKWGGDDLDLPFYPKRHQKIWAIRRRTFQKFEALVGGLERGLALDLGAGNCWFTRYLDRWGFDAIAVDIRTSSIDGLKAGQKFIDEGAKFLRVRAGMERLPFAANRIRLIAANASFHYLSDFRGALSDFLRVLTPGGMIAIIDSPFYEKAADGELMIADRVVEFRRKYGIPEALARRSYYLTFKDLEELAASLNIECRVYPVWPGLRRKTEEIRARICGRRIAQFPLAVLYKR